MAGENQSPDWVRIELDYRAGVKSLRQIASEHDISDTAIRKRAKRDEWERDLAPKIQAKADALVRRAQVRAEVRSLQTVAEKELVDANAQAIADVQLSHRKDIARTRSVTMALLSELELQTGAENVALLEQLGDLLRKPNAKGEDKLNDLYHKIIALPSRSKTAMDLSNSLRVLVEMERKAFGMDKPHEEQAQDTLKAVLYDIAQGNNSAFLPVRDDPEYGQTSEGDDE